MNKKIISIEAYENATSHGFAFDDVNRNLVEAYGELVEGLEHIKRSGVNAWFGKGDASLFVGFDVGDRSTYNLCLENTVEMEIADCYIRLMAMCGAEESKFETTALVTGVANQIVKAQSYIDLMQACGERILGSSGFDPILHGVCDGIEQWCAKDSIDLEWFVKVKMEYNKDRPYLHLKEQ